MSKYDVNFKRFALLLLPTFWRRPLLGAVAYAFVTPICYLHTKFIAFRKETSYRLTHNGQVCYLRAVLNDTFDPQERGISITETQDGESGLQVYLREKQLEKLAPRRGKCMTINRRGFSGVSSFDFFINIPKGLSEKLDTERLKAIVNTYKLVAKRYTIINM